MSLTENSNQLFSSWGVQQNSKFEIWPLDQKALMRRVVKLKTGIRLQLYFTECE